MTRDRVTGIISIILGAGTAIYASFLPKSGIEGDVGPAMFPYIAAFMLVVCGGALSLRRSPEQAAPFFTESVQVKRFIAITAVYVLYGMLLWAAGFLIATQLICFTLCVMMSGAKKISRLKLAVFSLVVTGVTYYCFFTLLSLKLPVGKLIKFVI